MDTTYPRSWISPIQSYVSSLSLSFKVTFPTHPPQKTLLHRITGSWTKDITAGVWQSMEQISISRWSLSIPLLASPSSDLHLLPDTILVVLCIPRVHWAEDTTISRVRVSFIRTWSLRTVPNSSHGSRRHWVRSVRTIGWSCWDINPWTSWTWRTLPLPCRATDLICTSTDMPTRYLNTQWTVLVRT